MAEILDWSPKRDFVMGGFGWTFSYVAHQQRIHFRAESFVNPVFVQHKSLFSVTIRGHSYEDIGTQVRASQTSKCGIFSGGQGYKKRG